MDSGASVSHKRVALVADKRTVTFFRLAGLKDTYPIESYKEAEECLRKISKDPDFLIILVTEKFVDKIRNVIEGITENRYPLIIPIQGVRDGEVAKTDLIHELIKRKAGIEFKL
jgi:vacuolar-type H+-ATPase subunit F/Vma7